MHRTSRVLVLLAATALPSQAATITYTGDTAAFPNPERGFFWQTDPDSADFRRARQQDGVTLFRWCIGMEQFRSASLSAAFLTQVSSGFAQARKAGGKVIPRFAYDYTAAGQDAPLDTVLRHIQQLRPVLAANADVIAFMEAGFIGAWGEWHSSASGIDALASKRAILLALLAALPAHRMVAVRTPYYKQDIFSTTVPLDSAQSFSGSDLARTGAHNDCLGASADDWGTYEGGQLEAQRDYLHADNRYLPMGGETCNPSSYSTCSVMPAEMQRMRWDALNLGYHQDVIAGWRTDGCFGEVSRKLGYRFVLLRADIQDSVRPGSRLQASIRLTNAGWGKCYNPRGLEMILRERTTGARVMLRPAGDPRRWLLGDTATLVLDTALATSVAEGDYGVFLNLPDTAAGLHSRPDYSIRLANRGVWEDSTGYNSLGHTLYVRASAAVGPRNARPNGSADQVLVVYDLAGRAATPARTGVYVTCPLSPSAAGRRLMAVVR